MDRFYLLRNCNSTVSICFETGIGCFYTLNTLKYLGDCDGPIYWGTVTWFQTGMGCFNTLGYTNISGGTHICYIWAVTYETYLEWAVLCTGVQ